MRIEVRIDSAQFFKVLDCICLVSIESHERLHDAHLAIFTSVILVTKLDPLGESAHEGLFSACLALVTIADAAAK